MNIVDSFTQMNAQMHIQTIWHKYTEVFWNSLKIVHLFLSLETFASKEQNKKNLNTLVYFSSRMNRKEVEEGSSRQ